MAKTRVVYPDLWRKRKPAGIAGTCVPDDEAREIQREVLSAALRRVSDWKLRVWEGDD